MAEENGKPEEEEIDVSVTAVEEALKAGGIPLPLEAGVALVRMVLRRTTSQGKLEREYAKVDGFHRKAMLKQLVRDAVDPLATAALHQLDTNERLEARLDQLVELLYRLLSDRTRPHTSPTFEAPTAAVPDFAGRVQDLEQPLAEAEALLQKYVAVYSRTYTHPETIIPFPCRAEKETVWSEDVIDFVAAQNADILLEGPSGCGKTLLACQAGLAFTVRGGIAITIPVKYYTDRLDVVLDREVRLLSGSSSATLLGAAKRLNRRLLFVVDGYNECAASERLSLTLGLAELARTYEANLLVVSQCPLDRGELLTLRTINVPSATPETKTAIALGVVGGDALPTELEHLLGAVATGLEAKLIGEAGQQIGSGSSRYALFDTFARKRLDDMASDGIRLLSQVAGWLTSRVAFSLSVRDLARLMDEVGVPHAVARRLQTAGLLTTRGDRVSFVHEMFFDAFAAENVIRCAGGRPAPVLVALTAPQSVERKTFIIGAIDDELLRDQVLDGLTDATVVAACLAGACGRAAREWADARAKALWDSIRSEARRVQFCISDLGWESVSFEAATLMNWKPSDRAFLSVMPQRIVEGHYLDEALDSVEIMDGRIAEERARLRDEARERKVAALRSALFANAYVFQQERLSGISRICVQLHGGFFPTTCDAVAQAIEQRLGGTELSSGQVYLLLMLSRGNIPAPLLARALEVHWESAPYHLRVDLLDAAGMCRPADGRERSALIAAIDALAPTRNPFVSTALIEALQSLGALEDSEREHITVVREEVEQCLAYQAEDSDAYARAYGMYIAQFDHPYCGAYSEVIAELSEEDRKRLMMMAVKGAPDDTVLFLAPLLSDLVSFGDSETGDAIARWIGLPPTDSFMRQDGIAVFMVAHIALARLGFPLTDPQHEADDHSARALASCGALLYWYNRLDLDEAAKRLACEVPLQILVQHEHGIALDVVQHCERAFIPCINRLPGGAIERSLVSAFPIEVAEICRNALARPSTQVGYFRHYSDFDRQQGFSLAIQVLARHGSSIDLRLLRRYADDAVLGTTALAAVKALEERLAAP